MLSTPLLPRKLRQHLPRCTHELGKREGGRDGESERERVKRREKEKRRGIKKRREGGKEREKRRTDPSFGEPLCI